MINMRYTPPTTAEIKALLKQHKVSEEEAAKMLGLSIEEMKNHIWNVIPFPYEVWVKLNKKLGE